jgi:hypothetical protein
MGDVNLGSVKAKLEFDASGVEQGVSKITNALNLTRDQIVALANATESQRVKMIAAFEAVSKGATQAAQSTAQWTEQAQRAAMRMSAMHSEALKMNAGFDRSAQAATGFSVGMAAMAAGITIAIGAAIKFGSTLAGLVADVARYSEQIDKMAKVTGLSTDMIQGLGKAAQETGTNSEVLVRAVAKMEAAIGNDSKAIKEMGLSLTQLKNASPEEMLRIVSTRLLSMTDVTERNAAAQKLLGRAYMDVLPALEQYAVSADRYVNLSKEQIAAGKDMDDALDAIGTAWKELGQQIGAALNTPEVREALRSLASSIREMALAVKDSHGPIAGFFQAIATGAQNAAKWFVFLSGAMDGMKERMASLSKDTPGAIARGMEALDAFDKRVAADKNKAWGREMFPSLFEQPTGGGGGISKELQSEMDSLSGAKAQAEVDNIAAAFTALQKSGRATGVDLDDLGKRLIGLAEKGAKIPDSLRPAIQAFAQTAAMKGVPQLAEKALDEMTKKAEGNIAKQAALKIKGWKEDEKAAEANAKALIAIDRSRRDILQRMLQDETLSIRQQYDIRRAQIAVDADLEIDQLRKRQIAATDPAIIAAIEAEIAAWERLAAAEIEATFEAQRYAQVSALFRDFGDILNGIADVFDAVGISADSTLGGIVSGLQTATAAVQNFAAQTTTAGKIGAGLSAVASIYKTGQEKGKAAGIASGALTGAGIGFMVGGPVGAAVGAVAGAVVGLVGALRKPEYKKIMEDVGKSWGVNISQGLAKEIEAIAKTHNLSRTMASLLATSKIMGESGKDPREFTGKINDLMNAIASGAVPAKEGLAELGKAFTMVADAAIAAGTVGDKAMVGLLKRARELGQVTPEMKAFVGAQLDSALAGINKYVAAIKKLNDSATTTPERLAEIGKTSGIVFGAMFDAMVSERGIVGAVDAMKDSYNTLHETLTETLGPEAVSAILGPFGGAFATLQDETLRPIFEGIDGITQAMIGLANAGYLSTDQFVAMQDATAQLFDEAVAGGADMRTALLAVAPGIQAAISAAEQFGVPLDADMARLKALADQNGITFKTDPQMAMLDVLVSIAQVLGADVPASALRAKQAMQDLASSVPNDLNVNVNVNRNYTESGGGGGETFIPPYEGGGPIEPYEGFQHGTGGFKDFGPGTPVVLHGREAVVTEKQAASMAGPSLTFNPTFSNDPLMSNESRAELTQYQIEEFVRQVRSNTLFQQILRDQGLR